LTAATLRVRAALKSLQSSILRSPSSAEGPLSPRFEVGAP
jgi:hypothetical protein